MCAAWTVYHLLVGQHVADAVLLQDAGFGVVGYVRGLVMSMEMKYVPAPARRVHEHIRLACC